MTTTPAGGSQPELIGSSSSESSLPFLTEVGMSLVDGQIYFIHPLKHTIDSLWKEIKSIATINANHSSSTTLPQCVESLLKELNEVMEPIEISKSVETLCAEAA